MLDLAFGCQLFPLKKIRRKRDRVGEGRGEKEREAFW